MEKLYYSIGEVAGILGETVSLVRFWSNSFPKFIKPKRNAKGPKLLSALIEKRSSAPGFWKFLHLPVCMKQSKKCFPGIMRAKHGKTLSH